MSYRDLIVWQKSKKLAVNIYKFTDYLPSKAKFSLAEQMIEPLFLYLLILLKVMVEIQQKIIFIFYM